MTPERLTMTAPTRNDAASWPRGRCWALRRQSFPLSRLLAMPVLLTLLCKELR